MEFTLTESFNATPEELYQAWLDEDKHSAMTGSPAIISDSIGDGFESWDGYIWGINISLTANERILQSWRTSDFTDEEADSRVEILLKSTDNGTELTLHHTDLPEHGEQYIQGWKDHYFKPMKDFFG